MYKYNEKSLTFDLYNRYDVLVLKRFAKQFNVDLNQHKIVLFPYEEPFERYNIRGNLTLSNYDKDSLIIRMRQCASRFNDWYKYERDKDRDFYMKSRTSPNFNPKFLFASDYKFKQFTFF